MSTFRFVNSAGGRMLNRATNPLFREACTQTRVCKLSPMTTNMYKPRFFRVEFNNSGRRGGNYSTPRFGKQQLMLLGGGSALFGLYYVTHLESVPISGRRRMIDVSPETELAMGVQAWEEVKSQYRAKILPPNDQRVRLVKQIAQPIIEASGLKGLQWEFLVVEQDIANAFVLPGGKVCVFTGIMKVASEPDELATVLSHEIGHVVARHNAEHWSFARVLYLGGNVIRLFVGDVVPDALINYLMYFGMELPFSRKCENEADHIGLLLMSKACYNPEKAISLWSKFQKIEGQKDAEFLKYLSTHPSHSDRVKRMQELLPEANTVREQSHCASFRSSFRRTH